MWLVMAIIPEVWDVLNGKEWDLMMLFVIEVPLWLVAGFGLGLWIQFDMNKKGKRRD